MKWQKNEKVRNAKKKVRMIVGELKNSWLFIKGTRAFIVKKIKLENLSNLRELPPSAQ